jgi:hypothetical protein
VSPDITTGLVVVPVEVHVEPLSREYSYLEITQLKFEGQLLSLLSAGAVKARLMLFEVTLVEIPVGTLRRGTHTFPLTDEGPIHVDGTDTNPSRAAENAFPSTQTLLFARYANDRDEHPLNALVRIVTTLLGNVTLVRPVAFWNAPAPMAVTVTGLPFKRT